MTGITQRWYTVTVDTEEEWDWSSGYSTQSRDVSNIHALERFSEACVSHGVPVTYFTNHTVLSQPETRAVIQRLHASGMAEIGLHIHPWNTPPLAQRIAVPCRDSFLANLPRDEAIAKLDTVYEAFEESALPVSPWIQEYLVHRGCIADASILPYTTWCDDGAPDFRDRSPRPVRRYMQGWPAALWEIPLTMGFTRLPWNRWRWLYRWGEQTPWRQLRLIGIAERLFIRRVWINLEHELGERAADLLRVIRYTDLQHVNITLHSSSLKLGCSPYATHNDDIERLYRRLDEILTLLQEWPEFKPVVVSDLAKNLERIYDASIGNKSTR